MEWALGNAIRWNCQKHKGANIDSTCQQNYNSEDIRNTGQRG